MSVSVAVLSTLALAIADDSACSWGVGVDVAVRVGVGVLDGEVQFGVEVVLEESWSGAIDVDVDAGGADVEAMRGG